MAKKAYTSRQYLESSPVVALIERSGLTALVVDEEGIIVYISPGTGAGGAVKTLAGAGLPLEEVFTLTGEWRDSPVLSASYQDHPGCSLPCDIVFLAPDNANQLKHGIILFKDGYGFPLSCTGEGGAESEEAMLLLKLSTAVEQSPSSVVITDVNGTIEYVNPKFVSLTGYSREEALGQNPRILKSGVQPGDFYREMWETLRAGKEWRGEFHNRKKNGESYWELASISPLKNSSGKVTNYIGVKEDITARKEAEEALRRSEDFLQKKNRIMEREINYAKAIVRMLLPRSAPQFPGIMTAFRYEPLDEVGGDYFSFFPSGEGLGVFVGDVAGHGVSAALFLSMIKSITDRLQHDHCNRPGLFLQLLNHELVEQMQSYFLTAVYGYFYYENASLNFSFAKAGHPSPLLLRKRTGTIESFKSRGTVLGSFMDLHFEETTVGLEKGDRLFLYTDGIIETANRERGMLRHEGFSALIREHADRDLAEHLDAIGAGLDNYRGGLPREDDIVLIGFDII